MVVKGEMNALWYNKVSPLMEICSEMSAEAPSSPYSHTDPSCDHRRSRIFLGISPSYHLQLLIPHQLLTCSPAILHMPPTLSVQPPPRLLQWSCRSPPHHSLRLPTFSPASDRTHPVSNTSLPQCPRNFSQGTSSSRQSRFRRSALLKFC